jgi:CRISPR system Cascade subunit CasB
MTSAEAAPARGKSKQERFVDRIVEVSRRDAGRRAQLRRGLRLPPERAVTMHAVVAPWLEPDEPRSRERAYYAVAAMIADQTRSARSADDAGVEADPDTEEPAAQQSTPGLAGSRSNLGASLAEAVRRDRGLAAGSAEKRLHLLVRQDLDGVHRQLPPLVRHLRTIGVPVDWPQLLDDLTAWPYRRDRITKTWLQSYYRAVPAESTHTGTTDTAENDR